MRHTPEQAWYVAVSRRKSLLNRISLLTLHSIVKASEPKVSEKNVTYTTTSNQFSIELPKIFTFPKSSSVGEVFKDITPVADEEKISILSNYHIIQENHYNYGLEIIDDQLALICLSPIDICPYQPKSFIILKPGSIENHPGTTFMTTYGRYLVNFYLLASVFCQQPGWPKEFTFVNDTWKTNPLEKKIAILLFNGKITPAHCDKYIDHGYYLSSIGEISGTTYTKKSIVPNKDILKARDELLEKHKDQLKDPRVMSIIENELIAMDKEYMKDDPAMDFLGDAAKKFNVHRKKMNISVGLIESFESTRGNYHYVPQSLSEGLDPHSFPAMLDESRKGFYDRAVETRVAGMDTKLMISVFQNSRVTGEDCKTKDLLTITPGAETAESFVGAFVKTGARHQIKPIAFPKEEMPDSENKSSITTTRIAKDKDSFQEKDYVISPWGATYQVTQKTLYTKLEEHPYLRELSKRQQETISGHEYSVLTLTKVLLVDGFTAITTDSYKDYIGKTVQMRSMQHCDQKDGFCSVCTGAAFWSLQMYRVGTSPIDVGALFLELSMKSMHGKKINTFELDNLDRYVINT